MMKMLTEYDYEPGEPVDNVTLIIYYQSLSQKWLCWNFFHYFAVLYCDCAHKYSYNILSLCHFSCL